MNAEHQFTNMPESLLLDLISAVLLMIEAVMEFNGWSPEFA